MTYERINFTTQDGVVISGDFYSVENPSGYVLLLHMMPAVKESWQELAKACNEAGLSALAIDFRGHGESNTKVDGTKFNYKDFTDEQQQSKILDIRGAMDWLRSHGADDEKIAVIGASIGANLALQYLAENHKVPTAVLMSPGLDFRGVKTDESVRKLGAEQSFMCIAALDDKYSYETCRDLDQLTQVRRENVQLAEAGHGTHMFNEPGLVARVVEWVKERLK